jgi:hypothetical protein
MAICATTQPENGNFGSTDTTASRDAMVADAMSRAMAGTEPRPSGDLWGPPPSNAGDTESYGD